MSYLLPSQDLQFSAYSVERPDLQHCHLTRKGRPSLLVCSPSPTLPSSPAVSLYIWVWLKDWGALKKSTKCYPGLTTSLWGALLSLSQTVLPPYTYPLFQGSFQFCLLSLLHIFLSEVVPFGFWS